MQGGQTPFDFRADHHRLIGAQRAEGNQLVAHQGFFHLHDFDQRAFSRMRQWPKGREQQQRCDE